MTMLFDDLEALATETWFDEMAERHMQPKVDQLLAHVPDTARWLTWQSVESDFHRLFDVREGVVSPSEILGGHGFATCGAWEAAAECVTADIDDTLGRWTW